MKRKISAALVAIGILVVSLAAPAPAIAGPQRWLCNAPRSGAYVVTTNYSLVQALYRIGYRCSFVREV